MKILLAFLTLTTITLSCPTKSQDFSKLKESTNNQYQLVKDLYGGKLDIEEFRIKTSDELFHDVKLIEHILNEHENELTKEDVETLFNINRKILETSKTLMK